MTSATPFLLISDLRKSFGTKEVLRGVDLSLEKGESLVILGGSGAGKSVLLRHIVGLYPPSSGNVRIDGVVIGSLKKKELYQFRRRVGMSFQEGAIFDSLSVFENIAFPIRRHHRHLNEKAVAKRVAECLDIVGMPTVGDYLPSELSGGMRRRVGFARAIALKPEILLLDEPTTGLDPIMTSVLGEVIVSMRENLNATTITITHDIGSAKSIATRTAMLFEGQVIYQDDVDPFFESSNPIVRQFLEGRAHGPATQSLKR